MTFVSSPCPTTARGGCKSTSYEHSCFPVKGKLTTELMPPCSSPAPSCLSPPHHLVQYTPLLHFNHSQWRSHHSTTTPFLGLHISLDGGRGDV